MKKFVILVSDRGTTKSMNKPLSDTRITNFFIKFFVPLSDTRITNLFIDFVVPLSVTRITNLF
jgi:hypothetical protein